MRKKVHISCPVCEWVPDGSCLWRCTVCDTKWNTFATKATCPTCGEVYAATACPISKGGCGIMSPHEDWYYTETVFETRATPANFLFWNRKKKPPVTDNDKAWIEQSLLTLDNLFGTELFKTPITITPEALLAGHHFNGTEEDAKYIFERVISVMQIDPWELQLMFYTNKPTTFTEGIVATPSDKLKGSWKGASGKYWDRGLGQKEIWLELGLLNDAIGLIATISHELSHYKLMAEYGMEYNDELLTDLVAISFGFGIFKGNSYFSFSQWSGHTHHGWNMQRSGYLPEQVIAYAMAWLAHYRTEDISWKKHLNKTMNKYFDQSYAYIESNPGDISWTLNK